MVLCHWHGRGMGKPLSGQTHCSWEPLPSVNLHLYSPLVCKQADLASHKISSAPGCPLDRGRTRLEEVGHPRVTGTQTS